MRTYTHLIESKSTANVANILENDWVFRSLTERDYGIDGMLEHYVITGIDKKGHPVHSNDGISAFVQIKGHETKTKFDKNKITNEQISLNTLKYIENLTMPCVLIKCSSLKGSNEFHYVWLQQYIRFVLNEEMPNWRSKGGVEKEVKITIKIPKENIYPNNKEKLEYILGKDRYLLELAKYHEQFENIDAFVKHWKQELGVGPIDNAINGLKIIKSLGYLLETNQAQLRMDNVTDLFKKISNLQFPDLNSDVDITDDDMFPFELLDSEIDSYSFLQNIFKSENFQYDY